MNKKRFIKLMIAAGLPPHIIRQAVDAVKSCGGRVSYDKFIKSIYCYYKLGFTRKAAITLTEICYKSPQIKKLKTKHLVKAEILPSSLDEAHEYFYPTFTIDEEKEETPKPWAKENPWRKV